MFVPRWEQAIKEFLRVLKPGGVLAFTVWGPADRVPFFGLTRDLAAGGCRWQLAAGSGHATCRLQQCWRASLFLSSCSWRAMA
jgi:SAM-dependent methyltransferase